MNKTRFKSFLTWTTTAISIALVGYVIYQGVESMDLHEIKITDTGFLFTVAESVLIVLAGSMILPGNFARILIFISSNNPASDFRKIVSIYCKTQIFKYLPGNVFHFLGRQVFLKNLSFRQIDIANTTLIEILGLATSAAFICIILGRDTLWFLLSEKSHLTDRRMFTGMLAALILGASIWLIYYIRKSKISFPLTQILLTGIYYMGYFLATSIALWIILTNTGITAPFQTVSVIFIAAWLTGFVTPGASAGIGLREATIYFLGNYLLGENLAFAALVLRLVTILGDSGQWLVGYILARSEPAGNNDSA